MRWDVGPFGFLVVLALLGLAAGEFFLFWVSLLKAVFVLLGLALLALIVYVIVLARQMSRS